MNPPPLSSTYDAPQKTQRRFDEIHIATLRLNSVLDFTLYTKIEGEFIVYRRSDLPFTSTQRQALIDNGLQVLHVASDQIDLYRDYLKGNIKRIIEEKDLDLEERAGAFYLSSRELVRRVIEYPLSPDRIDAAHELVGDSLRFLDEGKTRLHAIMAQMEEQSSLHTHALKVTQYGLALARTLGLNDKQEIEAIGVGLLVQDLGMLRIPQHLLFKSGPLSFDEWNQVKRHPALSLEAVDQLPDFPDLARSIIFGHHERLDGSGYPQGLAGDELSRNQRLSGIVDVFASLTTCRPFRDAYTTFDALRIMQTEMAELFDPHLLQTFITILGE